MYALFNDSPMKLSSTLAIVIVVAILVIAGFFYFEFASHVTAPTTATNSAQVTNVAHYMCDGNKTIDAAFTSNSVTLTLSDGRTLVLPQTISGSGIRYESTSTPGNDIVFSGKGDNAMFMENNAMPYANCVVNAAPTNTNTTTPSNGTSTFTDQGKTFTFNYPSQFSVTGGDGSYSSDWSMVNNSADGILLAKLVIPSSFEPKTNFADAKFTVGTSPSPDAVAQCLATPQSGTPVKKSTVVIHGTTYTKFVTTDAGAGNQYETTSYRTIRNGQCYAVEYTIHSTNLGNYDPSQGISAYDHVKVEDVLESIVQSFMFL